MLHFEFELLFVLLVVDMGILGILWKVAANNSTFSFFEKADSAWISRGIDKSLLCSVLYIF